MTVHRWVHEGHTFTDDDRGLSFQEKILVTADELTGGNDAKLNSARSVTGVPSRGDAHPSVAGITCLNLSGRINSGGHVEITINWGTPSSLSDNPLLDSTGIVEFFAAVRSEQTNRDKNDALMSVSWTGDLQDVYPDIASAPGITKVEKATVSVSKPQWGVQLTRRVATLGVVEGQLQTHIARVNSATWSGYAARTMLCVDIRADNKKPDDIRAVYRFMNNPDTWDVEVIARYQGVIPSTIDNPSGNGIGAFEIYEAVDFNTLPVSF